MIYLLGFGSNIDPQHHFARATEQLQTIAQVVAQSPALTTDTVGDTFHFPFMNQLVIIETDLIANLLKLQLQRIEQQLGREPKNPARKQKDRTIDIDILFQGNSIEACLKAPLEDSYNQQIQAAWLQQLSAAES